MKYIYGAEVYHGSGLEMGKYLIAKETEKTITTEKGCPCLGYRKRHSKKNDPIFRTPKEAVEALIRKYKNQNDSSRWRIKYNQELLNLIRTSQLKKAR